MTFIGHCIWLVIKVSMGAAFITVAIYAGMFIYWLAQQFIAWAKEPKGSGLR